MAESKKKEFYSDPASKPAPVPFDEAGVPEELRAAARWVPWRFVWKPDREGGGKWDKPPLSARTGRVADCTDPQNRGTLAEAVRWVVAGQADGVGFALGDGFVGLDLDDHRDPGTGDLSPLAREVVQAFPSYAEVSPSGTGIKVVGRGVFPPNTPKKVAALGLELFDRGYFTVTGRPVPGAAVADLQPAVNARLPGLLAGGKLAPTKKAPAGDPEEGPRPVGHPGREPTADEVERRVRSHPESLALMGGDASGHGGDDSAADLALCNLIAFYSAEQADLVDAVFRRSGLLRPKWDETHARDGRTYGQMTVAKALAGRREFFDWSEPPKVTFGAPAKPASSVMSPPAESAPWPTMPGAAYHGLAGEFVHLVEPHTEADPVALLVQFLVMFGSAAGRGAFVRVERTRHHVNEFVVLVGQSAKGRKGTSEAWPSDLMASADPGWSKHCRAGKLASGEALVWALRDPIYGNVDGEPRCLDEGVEDKRLLLVEGEFSAVLKIAAKEQNTLSDQLRDAWDGKDLNNKSKGSPCKATAPHVSALAHTNESDLKTLLTENAMANGFANRFVFFAVRRSKSLPFGGNVDEAAFAELADRVATRLEFARSAGAITWGADAAELWDRGCEYERLSRERYGLAGGVTGRAEAHVVRLAMLYALLDGAGEIGRPHLDAAVAVWGYAEQTAYRLFGGQTGDPLADDLLRLVRRHPAGVGRWELHQEVGKNIPAARIGAALATLRAGELARSEKRKSGGRHSEVWLPATGAEAGGIGGKGGK